MRLEFRITFSIQKRDNFQKRVETYGPPYNNDITQILPDNLMSRVGLHVVRHESFKFTDRLNAKLFVIAINFVL